MPQPKSTVCVTGASGFVGAHLVRELLARGYQVRGTIRGNAASSANDVLRSVAAAGDSLDLHSADLETAGAFDRVVEGCDVVFHTASPYRLTVDDPQRDLVAPAVDGTLNVLRAAAAAGVRRVVLTSSMAAITDEPLADHVFTERDWNERSSLTRNPYYYSKTCAERAAWHFMQAETPPFSLVVLNPFLIVGPSFTPALNPSNALFRDLLTGVYPVLMHINWGLVDVRDVATAHVLAAERPEAHGRYLCAGESLTMADLVEVLRHSGYAAGYALPRLRLTGGLGSAIVRLASYTQSPGAGSYLRTHVGRHLRYDSGRIRRELGVVFRPARESVLDAVRDLVRWTHLAPPATS